MSTYALRMRMVEIARRDVGRTEVSANRAPWIGKLWTATTYAEGMQDRQPYCAAGMAYCLREWGKIPEVLTALGMPASDFERWRCRSASVFSANYNWVDWARGKGLRFIDPVRGEFHAGDWLVYKYSHIELYVTDDATLAPDGVRAIGYNTDDGGARDGDGCFEKPRTRSRLLHVIRPMA
jgi:hypothetical protein